MQQAEQIPPVDETAASVNARVSLLAEVDFKWLMAGQGWWIDMTRFHCEPAYACNFLRLAMESESFPLRKCATWLQARIGGPVPLHATL